MPITWKKKFKPDLILQQIASKRSVSPEGGVSFSGFELHENLPVLASMLDFPAAAERVNKSSLIWAALTQVKGDLNKSSFEAAINQDLRKELSTSMKRYVLVTSLSAQLKGVPRSIKVFDATIEFLHKGIPRNFNQHHEIIKSHKLLIPDTPIGYLPVRIAIRDKSPTAAAQQAIDHLDLFRGLIALYVNFAMQWSLGGSPSFEPINRVRCGSRHTIHTPNGKVATESIWFEPNFRPAKIYELKDVVKLFKWIKCDLREVARSPYQKELTNALIKYARAFDEPDPNNAFVKLWSALESLTTPGVADYDKLVKRCCFLYADSEYHRQVLEHLREYRNRSVHSGIEGVDARANCFLLQEYFRSAVHFYKGNRTAFSSLTDANEFLDFPPDRSILTARLRALRKAIRFITPSEVINS
jgi:hypothetical protein